MEENSFRLGGMTWSWIYGCANCTWQEMAVACGLSVLAFGIWLAGLYMVVHKEGEEKAVKNLKKFGSDIKLFPLTSSLGLSSYITLTT